MGIIIAVIIRGLMCLWVGRGWKHFSELILMNLVRSQPSFANGSVPACNTSSSFLTHHNVIVIDHLPRTIGIRAERDLRTLPSPSSPSTSF